MFAYCDKLENFSSDISSLGDYSKIYENPEILEKIRLYATIVGNMFGGLTMPESYPPTTEEELSAWNSFQMIYLLTGNFMFVGCNLNSTSVAHILNSLSSYNDGIDRILLMTINPNAASTFETITGAVFGDSTIADTQYKGWTIECELKEQIVPTELDALKGSQYLDELKYINVSGYESFIQKLSKQVGVLGATGLKINSNKIYAVMGDKSEVFICNIECEEMISAVMI